MKNLSIEDLRKLYPVVLLATGASGDRVLGLEGEDRLNVRAFKEVLFLIYRDFIVQGDLSNGIMDFHSSRMKRIRLI